MHITLIEGIKERLRHCAISSFFDMHGTMHEGYWARVLCI
jgi:hypothetical protein